MRKTFALLGAGAVLLPALASALDYTDSTGDYRDAPYGRSEGAGISLLTNEGVVSGNDDGTFRPARTLNRAEFTKIALELWRIHEDLPFSDRMWHTGCFPDVQGDVWYADPVCRAAEQNIVEGNPDGNFRPERPVNLAEAVTILSRIFEYEADSQPGDQWYTPHLRAAAERGTALPSMPAPDTAITRGQMARLAAAFLAEDQGELAQYRAAEKGQTIRSSSSSVRSSSSSSRSSSSSVSSASSVHSSSSVSSGSQSSFEAVRSRFLILGERTKPIASVRLFADKEAVFVRSIRLELEDNVDSFDAIFVVDENGAQVAQLSLDRQADSSEETWTGTVSAGAYRVPKGTERVLAFEPRLKARNSGGEAEELVQVDTIRIGATGEDSTFDYTTTVDANFPLHQTAQARITSVTNAINSSDSIPVGNNQLLGAFTFNGTRVEGADLALRNLTFTVSKSSEVTVSNWQLGSADSSTTVPCTMNVDGTISCGLIPAEIGSLSSGPRTLRLFGDVALAPNAPDPFLQVSLNQAGSPGSGGAITWTDGVGIYTWTELESPIARSTRFD